MAVILIYAIPRDYHANAVAWGLAQLGLETEFWVPGDLPDKSAVSIFLGEASPRITVRHAGRAIDLSQVKLIWNRRLDRPQAPDHSAPEDKHVIESQCFEHIQNVKSLLSASIPTGNPPSRQAWANRKAVQLEKARELGATVPATLLSNDFEEIKAFWQARRPVVAKSYRTTSWKSGGEVFASFTTRLQEPSEDLRLSFELCPHIFQEEVPKVSEARVIAFGDHRFALDAAPDDAGAMVDTRFAVNKGRAAFKAVDLPAGVATFISEYMDALGLRYGAFDFGITREGEWVFFECNEGGHYLEHLLPQYNVLDAFCRWLAELAGHVQTNAGPVPRVSDFDASGDPLRSDFWSTHKDQLGNRGFIIEDPA